MHKSYTHYYYYKEYNVYLVDNSDDGDDNEEWGSSPALQAYNMVAICVDRCAHDNNDLRTFENDKYGMYYDNGHNCTTTFIEKFYRTNDANAQVHVKVMHIVKETGSISVCIKIYIDTVNPEYQFFFENIDKYVAEEFLCCEGACGFSNDQDNWHNQCLYEYNKY